MKTVSALNTLLQHAFHKRTTLQRARTTKLYLCLSWNVGILRNYAKHSFIYLLKNNNKQ